MTNLPLSFEIGNYTSAYSGSLFHIKSGQWKASSTSGRPGRYNGPGTGSLYLAEDHQTCELEIGGPEESKHVLWKTSISGDRFLRLDQANAARVDVSPLMERSGSLGDGWKPTREVSDHLFENGYAGVVYPSRHDGKTCVAVYVDILPMVDSDFDKVKEY